MNRYVADPQWHSLIVVYFFLGGIAAGAYAMASLAALFGSEEDRRATRGAYYLAFPLVCLCGLLLIIDLGRPERFWHMMIQSNTWRPMLKWWSPMSIGSWGLSIFGGFSFVSFLGVLSEDRILGLGRWSSLFKRLESGWFARAFSIGGSLAGFFLGAYTGCLLAATNQPIWSDTNWLAALFVASAASTGMAATVLIAPWLGVSHDNDSLQKLERLDRFAIVLEVVMIGFLAWSVREWAKGVFTTWPGLLVPAFVVPFGLLIPAWISGYGRRNLLGVSAVMVLIGGYVLRAAVVGMPIPWINAHY